jgi:hypothetical protein
MITVLNEVNGDPYLQLYFNFHDHIILVSCNEEAVCRKLQEEFHYFLIPSATHVETTIELFVQALPEIPPTTAHKILETCTIFEIGGRRYLDYQGEALSIWDKLEDSVRIYSTSSDRLYELGFLAIHSLLGQALDRKGLCRVHAVAVSLGNCNALVMLPSKGGKSTLLAHLLENPEVKIISDDMPLVDTSGLVHAFPSKISMSSPPTSGPLSELKWTEFKRAFYPVKYTAGLSQIETRIERQSFHNRTLLIAGYRLSQGESILTPVKKWKMLAPLMEHMIMGFGLPQILEMFLHFNILDVLKLSFHGLLRTVCALQLLRKSDCYHFYLGPDRAYNAQLLLDQLYERQS